MSNNDFDLAMALLIAACGKPVPEATCDAYRLMLGHLRVDVLRAAIMRAIVEHRYPTLPTIAMLLDLADQVTRPMEYSPDEVWRIAWNATKRLDIDIHGNAERVLASVPPLVAQVMRTFGLRELCGVKSEEWARKRWLEIYEQLARREQRARMLPPALRELAERIGAEQRRQLPAPARGALRCIGNMDAAPTAAPTAAPVHTPPAVAWDDLTAAERGRVRETVLAELSPDARARLLDRPEMLEACCRNRAASWRRSA
jgi:hypothetical protein